MCGVLEGLKVIFISVESELSIIEQDLKEEAETPASSPYYSVMQHKGLLFGVLVGVWCFGEVKGDFELCGKWTGQYWTGSKRRRGWIPGIFTLLQCDAAQRLVTFGEWS